MNHSLRSECPIAASLDVLGDRWTLVILRDLLMSDRSHFGEFAEAESVATNILASRLAALVDAGLIERLPDPEDGRKAIYRALPPAIELLPVLAELASWGLRHTPVPSNPDMGLIANPETRPAFVEQRTRELLQGIS